jgi:hypothetical protein
MRILSTLLLLVISTAAQTIAKTELAADVPCVPLTDLSSPDQQWTLLSRNYRLLIQNNRTRNRQFLRLRSGILECVSLSGNSCGGIQVGWSPDSGSFFLNDEQASDRTSSYVFTPATGQAMNLADLLSRHDPQSVRWLRAGHSYVYARRWLNPKELLVNVAGHFDEPAAKEFEIQYRVNVASGSVARLSAREHAPEDEPPFQQATKQPVR